MSSSSLAVAIRTARLTRPGAWDGESGAMITTSSSLRLASRTTTTASALANVFAGLRGNQFTPEPLKKWNSAHGVIGSGAVPGREFCKYLQLDWKQHHFEFTRADTWPQYYQVTISAPTLWQGTLQMKVPYDKLPRAPHPKKEPGFGPIEISLPSPLTP